MLLAVCVRPPPPPPPSVHIAVLQPGETGTIPMLNDTVLIVDLDGKVKAKTTFAARKVPFVGNAAALLQPEARVATGKVYYQDQGGDIRSLTPTGAIAEVTAFPLTSPQQLLSFAVKPDGSQLMATVLTLPLPGPTDPNTGRPTFASGPFKIEVKVSTGATVNTVRADTFTMQSLTNPNFLSMVGWDSGGPLATTDTMLATQANLLGWRWYGRATRLDPAGQPGVILGGSDCWAWAVQDGTVLCSSEDQSVASLRSTSGTVEYSLPMTAPYSYGYLTLAPGGTRFTYAGLFCTAPKVVTAGGLVTALPPGFCPQGWLDADTVIGSMPEFGHLFTVRVGQQSAHDLGVRGLFVGTVTA